MINIGELKDLESDKRHPLSSVITYNKMTSQHRNYSLQLSAEEEPKTYNAVVKSQKWINAIQAEIVALAKNKT